MKLNFGTLTLALCCSLGLTACGKKSTATASFKVQLNNSASLYSIIQPMAEIFSAATSITAKLGGVDILADCTGGNPPGTCLSSNRSPDPDIWVNEGCNNDIAQCTTSNTQFFELIDPTAANTILNSQCRSIETGTYTHVRIYFLNNDAGDALKCNGNPSSARPNVPITVELPSSLTVAQGESVTVTLNYNPTGVDCNDSSAANMVSSITATATKN